MIIISRKALVTVGKKNTHLGRLLDAWFRIAKAAKWTSLEDVRRTYANADGVPVGNKVYTVFNIGGNSYRLIAGINYQTKRVFIKHVLTHAQYNTGDWKK